VSERRTSFPARLLAEFAVVVFGVVVGLGVDEWRQTLSERAEERLYYERLAQDLAADVANWQQLLQQLTPKDEALVRIDQWVAAAAATDVHSLRELAQDLAMGAVYSGSVPPPRRSTYQELLSTGKIDVIRDRRFRAALIDYHFAFDNLLLRVSSRTTDYERLAYSLVPREIRGTGDNFASGDLSESELRSMAEGVRARGELRSLVVAERNRTVFVRSQFEVWVSNAQALMEKAVAGSTKPST
jgi:hypothetical protein